MFNYKGGDTVISEVPSADEVLAFANKVREAGGADVLEALLPSEPGDSNKCLIANALNFSSAVAPLYAWEADDEGAPVISGTKLYEDGTAVWAMYLPDNVGRERAEKIAEVTGMKLLTNAANGEWLESSAFADGTAAGFALELPVAMRNAAMAFDSMDAFQEFRSCR